MRCLVAGCQQLYRAGENRAYYNLSQAFIMDLFQVNTQIDKLLKTKTVVLENSLASADEAGKCVSIIIFSSTFIFS